MRRTIVIVIAACVVAQAAQPEAAQGRKRHQVAARPAAPASLPDRISAANKLAKAVDLLRRKESSSAARLLSAIVEDRPVPGVTDEAIFRLALLSMKPGAEGAERGLRLLKRLQKEFPASPWSVQADPVLKLLVSTEELRRENRTLKAANQSLTAEKEGLQKKVEESEAKLQQANKNLEQLKRLDLELEQKAR